MKIFWACGSLVVFAYGFVVLWIACGFWNARSALRVRNGKSHAQGHRAKVDACHVREAHCVRDGKSCAHEPTTKPKKPHDVVFAVFVVFVWLVVFCRLCGFLSGLCFSRYIYISIIFFHFFVSPYLLLQSS